MPIDVTANFIRIRVASPKKFVRFRIKTLGKGIKAVVGFMAGGGSQIQSFLFPKRLYTLKQAKAWIKSHNYSISECYLVTNIEIEKDYIDIQEILITPEMETELMLEEPKVFKPDKMTKEELRELFK